MEPREEGKGKDVSLGVLDWGELFGLVGSSGDYGRDAGMGF